MVNINVKTLACLVVFLGTHISTPNTAFADSQPPSIKIRYNNDLAANGSWTLGVKAQDDTAVEEIVVFYKSSDDESFSTTSYQPQDDYTWKKLSVGKGPTTVSFYVQATDISGNLASRGSAKKPLTVDVSIPNETASTTTASKAEKPADKKKLDYGDNCKKVGMFKRASTKTALTTKTKNKNGKKIPHGRTSAIKIGSDKVNYLYTKWSNLRNKDYNLRTLLYDSNNRLVLNSKYSFKSEWVAGNGWWTTWVTYTPKKNDPTGVWTYVICEDGKRQVEKRIKVVD